MSPRRVRLALFGPGYPFRGGIAYFTHRLADELGRDDRVSSLWVPFARQYPNWLFPGASDQQPDGFLRTQRGADARWDPWNPRSAFRVARLASEFAADVAVLPWWVWLWAPADLLLIWALRRQGVGRIAAIVHNYGDHEQAMWKKAFARMLLARCDLYMTHTQAIAEPLQKSFPGRPVAVSHLPLHPLPGDREKSSAEARRCLSLPPDDPIFLFFGIIRPYKGLDLLLDAWPQIRQQTGGTLVIAGEFWGSAQALRKKLEISALAGGIVLDEGYVPDERVVDLFRAADLVVLPYRAATGTGVVPVATWFRRPVLASAVPGIVDVVKHEVNGLLFPPGDAAALGAEAIRFVRERLGDRLAAGVAEAEATLSWSHYVSALLQLADPAAQGAVG